MKKRIEYGKLADVVGRYSGKVVRIGTAGSGYYVCGVWNEDLLKDLNQWEETKKKMKKQQINKLKEVLAKSKVDLPEYLKKLPELEKEAQETKAVTDEISERVFLNSAHRDLRRQKVRNALESYSERLIKEFEEAHKDIQGKERRKAHYDFTTMLTKRKKQYNRRLERYLNYLARLDALDLKELTTAEGKSIVAGSKYDELVKKINNAKARIEVYPGKIRDGLRYLSNYTPFMEREVRDVYGSDISKGETSIIVNGRETGPFWDCEEFNIWKNSGVVVSDRENTIERMEDNENEGSL